MDFSFSRRRNAHQHCTTPDFNALLSSAAARQAQTPTARAHWRGTTFDSHETLSDPRIDFFAGLRLMHRPAAFPACFAVLPPALFSSRQGS